jgi:hypothetical protein
VRRSIYQRFGDFDITFKSGNDVELMMRFLEKYRIRTRYLPEVMVRMRLGGASNNNIKGIIEQNRQILQAARKWEIPISPVKFIFYKVLSRLWQWMSKPKRDYHYAK